MITSYVTLTDAPWKEILQFAIMLLAILNPVAGASIYLALVEKYQYREKLLVARKTSCAILIILLSIIWLGDTILAIFGISLAAFRIGGGFLVVLIGLTMLGYGKVTDNKSVPAASHDISIVPLAIPVIAGPGVIAVTLTEMQNTFDSVREKIIITLVTLILVLIMWLVLRFAPYVAKKLGHTGIDIMTKIMGLILVVIAVQMMLEGCLAVFPAWAR